MDSDKELKDSNNSKQSFNLGALGNLYRGLIANWIHQDMLMQSRSRLLIGVQGAIIGASFYLYIQISKWYAFSILIVGVIINMAILRLSILDERDRDLALPLIVWAAKKLLQIDEKKLKDKNILSKEQTLDKVFGMYIPLSRFEGGPIIRGSLWLFVVIDIAIAFLVIAEWIPIRNTIK